jgi:ATP-dependent RNA helicase DDX10/DBP4
MFERKNRSVLSEHYNKLVDHGAEALDEDEDFITLKRADHDLPSTLAELPVEENTSNRRRRAMVSKKGQIKYGGLATRLVFDDDGVAHQVLEMKEVEEVFGKGDPKNAALEAGRAFSEKERTKISEVDKKDKAEAKEKRKEKKRKRKEATRGGVRRVLSSSAILILIRQPGTGTRLGRRRLGGTNNREGRRRRRWLYLARIRPTVSV